MISNFPTPSLTLRSISHQPQLAMTSSFLFPSKQSIFQMSNNLQILELFQTRSTSRKNEKNVSKQGRRKRLRTSDAKQCRTVLSYIIFYSGHQVEYFLKSMLSRESSLFQKSRFHPFLKHFEISIICLNSPQNICSYPTRTCYPN